MQLPVCVLNRGRGLIFARHAAFAVISITNNSANQNGGVLDLTRVDNSGIYLSLIVNSLILLQISIMVECWI